MAYSVTFAPEAREQLRELYRHIEKAASPAIAQRFTNDIVSHCESFRESPKRAIRRYDIRPGLHVTHYRGRVVIALAVADADVSIVGIYYGGRDYEQLLRFVREDDSLDQYPELATPFAPACVCPLQRYVTPRTAPAMPALR